MYSFDGTLSRFKAHMLDVLVLAWWPSLLAASESGIWMSKSEILTSDSWIWPSKSWIWTSKARTWITTSRFGRPNLGFGYPNPGFGCETLLYNYGLLKSKSGIWMSQPDHKYFVSQWGPALFHSHMHIPSTSHWLKQNI